MPVLFVLKDRRKFPPVGLQQKQKKFFLLPFQIRETSFQLFPCSYEQRMILRRIHILNQLVEQIRNVAVFRRNIVRPAAGDSSTIISSGLESGSRFAVSTITS